MDQQMENFLNEYVEKALTGSGFAIYSPQEKEEIKSKLNEYFGELIFDTLLRSLNDEQLREIQSLPDLTSQESLNKISVMSASVPGFIFIVQDRFEKEAEQIGRTGKIPELNNSETPLLNSF